MKLSVIAQKTQGQLFGQDLDVCQFSTDTRTLTTDDVFIALNGANFDANSFVAKAQDLGAVAAIVSQYQPELILSQTVVANTQTALGLLAKT